MAYALNEVHESWCVRRSCRPSACFPYLNSGTCIAGKSIDGGILIARTPGTVQNFRSAETVVEALAFFLV